MKEERTPAPERRAAFAALVTEHSRAMYRTARSLLPGDADAEDAVGEAVLLAWQAFSNLRDERTARAWLVKITINCARSQLHVPQGTVKSRLSRARERLRAMLGEEESP